MNYTKERDGFKIPIYRCQTSTFSDQFIDLLTYHARCESCESPIHFPVTKCPCGRQTEDPLDSYFHRSAGCTDGDFILRAILDLSHEAELRPIMKAMNRKRHEKKSKAKRRIILGTYRAPLSPSQKQLLREAQEQRCYYCLKMLQDECHLDHKKPVASGGTHETKNIVAACPECNDRKWITPSSKFISRLQKDLPEKERLDRKSWRKKIDHIIRRMGGHVSRAGRSQINGAKGFEG